ncbi:ABC transporter permease, partial [Enterococcus faecium]
MTNNLEISNLSLLLSSVLLIVALLIDYKEKLGLGNDIFIAGIRAVVQLFLIGYVLSYVLRVDNNFLTLAMVLFIVFNASYNAHTRSEGINRSFKISTTAIGVGTALSLLILVFSGVIDWSPSQIVPITGMIASNAMTAIGVTYRS